MKKHSKRYRPGGPTPPTNTHFENLIELRQSNPQAYARLGEKPNLAVEKYECERLASTFEHREGTERLLELKERMPMVFARFNDDTKRMVEKYAKRKRAYEIINGSITG